MLDEHIFLESDSNFYNFCYDSNFWSAHPFFSDIILIFGVLFLELILKISVFRSRGCFFLELIPKIDV